MKKCPTCHKLTSFGKVPLKIGELTFELKTFHCTNCEDVFLSERDQEAIDRWGSALTVAVKDYQPYFSDVTLDKTLHYAAEYGLKWPEFIKVCTAYYLFQLSNDRNFKKIREQLLGQAATVFVASKSKVKRSLPVRYRLFKKLQLFSEAWNILEVNVIEEAVICSLGLLDLHHSLTEQKRELTEYINEYSTAS